MDMERDMHAIDLRRRPEPGLVDLILMRAEYLAQSERALLEAYYRRGVDAADLALLEGKPARSIRRRVRSLSARVLDDLFVYVMRSIDRFGPTRQRIARGVYLQGTSRRAIAQQLGLSLHTVRRHCDAIEELARAQERAA